MLTSLFTFVALQAATALPAPVAPSHSGERRLNPVLSTRMVEWFCKNSGNPSRIVFIVRDVGAGRTRNKNFTMRLVELTVEGKAPRPEISQKLRESLNQLNTISIFEGQCRGSTPGVVLTGHSYVDGKDLPKNFEFDLR